MSAALAFVIALALASIPSPDIGRELQQTLVREINSLRDYPEQSAPNTKREVRQQFAASVHNEATAVWDEFQTKIDAASDTEKDVLMLEQRAAFETIRSTSYHPMLEALNDGYYKATVVNIGMVRILTTLLVEVSVKVLELEGNVPSKAVMEAQLAATEDRLTKTRNDLAAAKKTAEDLYVKELIVVDATEGRNVKEAEYNLKAIDRMPEGPNRTMLGRELTAKFDKAQADLIMDKVEADVDRQTSLFTTENYFYPEIVRLNLEKNILKAKIAKA